MNVTDAPSQPTGRRFSRSEEAARVFHAVEDLCVSLKPGDRIPTHVELMRRFNASERTVLRSLDELQRQGRIIRRHGSGTFVADHTPAVPSAVIAADDRTVVAIAAPDRSFFDRCMEQLYEYTSALDLGLICRPLDPGRDTASIPLSALGSPLGFLLFGYNLAELAKRLQDDGHRVVVLGAPPFDEIPDFPCVHGAHEQGGYLAIKHLLDLGHRRLAFVPSVNSIQRTHRWVGVQRAIKEAQRSGCDAEVTVVDIAERDSWRDAPDRLAAYVRRSDGPTALMSWNDAECARLLSVLLQAGVSVPGEVSLVGYDALAEGELVHPPLTTVDPHIGQLLSLALSVLVNPSAPKSHTAVVMPKLVVRQSSAPPRPQPTA